MTQKSNPPAMTIALTAEQQVQIEQATGKQVAALHLKLEELEQRLAPGKRLNN